MKGLKGLLGGLMDDKGLFQGGEQGRMFGRLRDRMGGRGESYDPGMEEGNELAVHARDFAKTMDVSDKDQVFEMQNMLNELGIKDFEGKALKADSMMGDRTTSAMRMLQGQDFDGESVEKPQESFDYEPGKDPSGPVDPWAESDKSQGNSIFENMKNLFGGGGGEEKSRWGGGGGGGY
jgi:hypothetical protein